MYAVVIYIHDQGMINYVHNTIRVQYIGLYIYDLVFMRMPCDIYDHDVCYMYNVHDIYYVYCSGYSLITLHVHA